MTDKENTTKPKTEVQEKGDRPNPRARRPRSGAGVLPIALYENRLHLLVQHEIRQDTPDDAKNFGFTDFGGSLKPEDNENIHLVAARKFRSEIGVGLDQLLPEDLRKSDEVLAEHLKTCRLTFVQGYAMFILPVHFIPACILAEALAKDEYRSTKKIQTMWWFSLLEAKRVYLPLHSRVLARTLLSALTAMERRLRGTVSDKPRRFGPGRFNNRRRRRESGDDGDVEKGEDEQAAKTEAELEEEKRLAEEEGKQWAADVKQKSEEYQARNEAAKVAWTAKLAQNASRYKMISRRCMWETMDMLNQVTKPSPCVNRIPNFMCSDLAGRKLADCNEFRRFNVVKVNPSLAQTFLRVLTLNKNKILLTPSPALEGEHFMHLLDPKKIRGQKDRTFAASKKGALQLGEGMTAASDWTGLHIDMVVVGSVVVCPTTGARMGKGTGWAELEVAILTELGVIDEKTVFATTVHDCQIVFGYPDSELSQSHDLHVDLIATPTRVIRVPKVEGAPPRQPARIQWKLIDEAKLNACPILREMKERSANGVPPAV